MHASSSVRELIVFYIPFNKLNLAVPASCSWAGVLETALYRIKHSAWCRDRHWFPELFRNLQNSFEKKPGIFKTSIPYSMLCDASFVNQPLEDGRVCHCQSSTQFNMLELCHEVQSCLLRARNAVGLACNADRKPDRLTFIRLNDA